MIPFLFHFFLNHCLTFNLSFSFISDLWNEITLKHKSDILEGLLRIDPGIADVKNHFNCTLLHHAVYYNSTSCVEVLLKLAPHLIDVVTTENRTPLQYAKRYSCHSIEAITMLEDHLKNR